MTGENVKVDVRVVVREWLIARYLAGQHKGYEVASQETDLPPDYGDFYICDGIDLIAGGSTPNLRTTFRQYLDRLLRAEVPIFFWKPDSDGKVREWLDGKHDPDPNECLECHGTGETECSECHGTGKTAEGDSDDA